MLRFIVLNTQLFLGGLLLVFSLIPIASVKEKRLILPPKEAQKFLKMENYRKIFKELDKKKLFGESISLLFLKLGLYWPLYVGLVIFATSPYSGLGIITGIGSLFSAISVFIIGRLVDKGYERKIVDFGVWLEIGLGISRFFVQTPVSALAHDIAWKNRHAHRVVGEKWYLNISKNYNEKLALMDVIMFFRHLTAISLSLILLVLIIIAQPEQELEMIKYFCIGIAPLATFIWFLKPNKNTSKKLTPPSKSSMLFD